LKAFSEQATRHDPTRHLAIVSSVIVVVVDDDDDDDDNNNNNAHILQTVLT
jgi:hypothetical protein